MLNQPYLVYCMINEVLARMRQYCIQLSYTYEALNNGFFNLKASLDMQWL